MQLVSQLTGAAGHFLLDRSIDINEQEVSCSTVTLLAGLAGSFLALGKEI